MLYTPNFQNTFDKKEITIKNVAESFTKAGVTVCRYLGYGQTPQLYIIYINDNCKTVNVEDDTKSLQLNSNIHK